METQRHPMVFHANRTAASLLVLVATTALSVALLAAPALAAQGNPDRHPQNPNGVPDGTAVPDDGTPPGQPVQGHPDGAPWAARTPYSFGTFRGGGQRDSGNRKANLRNVEWTFGVGMPGSSSSLSYGKNEFGGLTIEAALLGDYGTLRRSSLSRTGGVLRAGLGMWGFSFMAGERGQERLSFPWRRCHIVTMDFGIEAGLIRSQPSATGGGEVRHRAGFFVGLGIILAEARFSYAVEQGPKDSGHDTQFQLGLLAPLSFLAPTIGYRRLDAAGQRLHLLTLGIEARF
jgi:hypothetical protein